MPNKQITERVDNLPWINNKIMRTMRKRNREKAKKYQQRKRLHQTKKHNSKLLA